MPRQPPPAESRASHRTADHADVDVDMLEAQIAGDALAYYRAHLDAPRIAPNALAHYGLGHAALNMNRPAEALAVFRSIDPERGELRGWLAYWSERTRAEHVLGRHRDELRSARRARVLHPLDPAPIEMEVTALAALGRIRELRQVIEGAAANHPAPHQLLRVAGLERLAHGDSVGGMTLLHESLLLGQQTAARTVAQRWWLVRAHYLTGRFNEAHALLQPLLEEMPRSMVLRGAEGALAARMGDVTAARAADAWLAGLDQPYMYGQNTYLRTRIAALLGEHDEAVRLLQLAWREGHRSRLAAHDDPDLRPLYRQRAFREFIQPDG